MVVVILIKCDACSFSVNVAAIISIFLVFLFQLFQLFLIDGVSIRTLNVKIVAYSVLLLLPISGLNNSLSMTVCH